MALKSHQKLHCTHYGTYYLLKINAHIFLEFFPSNFFAGGYTPFNDPPQGEVLVSGSNISAGYWKQPEKAAEDFVIIDGVRYFATGDIGEFREDGSLRIIGLHFPDFVHSVYYSTLFGVLKKSLK